MKIRTDFVTNSSSSSFIVGFVSESDIDFLPLDGALHHVDEADIKQLMNDIKHGEIPRDEAYRIFKQDVRSQAEDQVMYHGDYARMKLDELRSSKSFKRDVDRIMNQKLNKFNQKSQDYTFFSEINYSDHDNAALENACYYLECTLGAFNWH